MSQQAVAGKVGKKEKPPKAHILKNLTPYMRGAWKYAILAWTIVAVEVVCEVLIPYFSQFIINVINPGKDALDAGYQIAEHTGELFGFAFAMIGMAILSCTAGIFAAIFAAICSARFGRNLRQAMYYKIQEYSFKNIDRFSTSSLVTRLTTDVTNVQNALQGLLRIVIRAPFMLIFALIMSWTISWQFGLLYLAVIPFLGAVLFGVAAKVHPIFARVFETYDSLNASVQENLQGIRVVKSFAREESENQKFSKVSGTIYKMFVKAERRLAFNSPAMQLSVYVCVLVISYFGARMVIGDLNQGPFTTGSLTTLFSYTMQILTSLMMVSMVFVMITISRNSSERVIEVLKEKSDIVSPENPLMEVPNGSVDFEHVNFRYNQTSERDVLHDINLHIPSGSTVGIIGATGSSKSSLVSLIARLYDVTAGEVKVGGHNVKEYDLKVLRDSVSVVLQKNVLFTGTIRSNLLWGNPSATQEDLEKAAKLACADEFIEKFPQKYDSPIDQGGTNVSGGQRQRLCIARALLKNPRILILDDSTSAVDTRTDASIRHSFKTEIPDVTKFIVAQRVLSIKDSDLVIVLDKGEVVQLGSPDELLAKPGIYKEIYESQLGGGDFDAAN